MNKKFEIYNHEFAVWTAARASQRNFTTSKIIKQAINDSDLNPYRIDFNFDSQIEFDKWHKKICHNLVRNLRKAVDDKKVTYGRVAKIVNIYLKTAYIIPNKGKSELTKYIHPPIDRVLLKNLMKEFPDIGIKKISWTSFTEKDYTDIIDRLKNLKLEHLWEVEEYWGIE